MRPKYLNNILRWDVALTVLLVACALVTTGLVVKREFFSTAGGASKQEAKHVDNWRQLLNSGRRIGPGNAAVQIIEFSDFQCPFCAQFHKSLSGIRAKYPNDIALTYVHYPLPMHQAAIPAANAAECAGDQGKFEAMHDLLFARQSDLGTTAWDQLALAAGVPNIGRFNSCMAGDSARPLVAKGQRLAQALAISGTPTVIVNGWNVGTPSPQQLETMIKEIKAGRPPVS